MEPLGKRNGGDKTLYSYGFVEEDIAVNDKDFQNRFYTLVY